MDKKAFKKSAGTCRLCGEPQYEALHVHRIIAGTVYRSQNCVVLCASCHAKIHGANPSVVIDRYYLCTDGTDKLRIIEDGIEKFI